MKRIMFICLTSILSIVAYAGNIKANGNKSVLKEHTVANVVFDFSHTTWEEEETFKEYCNDGTYDERIEIAQAAFLNAFNQNSNGLKFAKDSADSKYNVIIRIDNFEQKQSMYGWGRFYIKVYGEILIQDAKSNQTVLTLTVKGISGSADYVQTDRFEKSFTVSLIPQHKILQ